MPRRIDIVTHYWPPIGGPGSRKMQMWARAFVEAGYRVRVVTPIASPRDLFFDPELEVAIDVDVLRLPLFDPARRFRRNGGRQVSASNDTARPESVIRRTAVLARNLLRLPDQRRIWVGRAARAVLQQQPDILVTTSPYDSTHLVGLKVRQSGFGGCWVADFRDRWDHRRWIEGAVSRWHSRYNDWLERRIVDSADVLTYSNEAGLAFAERQTQNKLTDRAVVVRNALSREDLSLLKKAVASYDPPSSRPLRLVHVGTIWPYRVPDGFVPAWRDASVCGNGAVLHQYGVVDAGVAQCFDELNTGGQVVMHGQVDRREALCALAQADAVVLFIGAVRVEIASKLYEALAAGKPLLYLGDAGGAGAALLRQLGASAAVVDAQRGEDLNRAIGSFLQAVASGQAADWTPADAPGIYSLDSQMARLLQRLPPP